MHNLLIRHIQISGSSMVTTDSDGYGHGTHVAGTVGGNTAGVARCSNVYGMQVFEGMWAWSDDIYEAMQVVKKAHRNKANAKSIVTMSLGGKCMASDPECASDLLVIGTDELTRKGIVVVVAAGNEAAKAHNFLPAGVPNAITVGASQIDDTIAAFSNFGSMVDIFAPGRFINSACPRMRYFPCDPNGFVLLSGTSMATPHVTGVVAQLLEKTGRSMTKLSDVEYITKMLLENAVDKIILTEENKHTTVKLLQVAPPAMLRRA
ncbi:hypothetical protein EON64_04995 [archaeon]|nr:MAG: hypothetical protein EON64_04995 [archaeon]